MNRSWNRRTWLAALTAAGVGNEVFRRALWAQGAEAEGKLTLERIQQAEWIAGITLDDEARTQTLQTMERLQQRIDRLRKEDIGYELPPAISFSVLASKDSQPEPPKRRSQPIEWTAGIRPSSEDDLAFLPVTELSALIRDRSVSSLELTQLYLKRLKALDQKLKCVVTLTEDLALRQARQADEEIGAGHYRGPLHGIPWGAKDLIAYPGYPTTWGAPQFKERILTNKATVAQRLDDTGAVLVAKLSLGALAMGDKWYEGMTRNPWDTEQGSSGSSAGSASAVVAGLVGFTLGSETLGSIVSPCTRCGASGLRPTFGRVSRHGCMALSWTMDKIGPITRSVEDAALVFDAIHGADGLDETAQDRSFDWPTKEDIRHLRVGYLENTDSTTLEVLRSLGVQLKPISLPSELPVWEQIIILTAEAATAFHDFTRDGITEGLNTWPNEFRQGHFITAVDYLRANRLRTKLMREMNAVFEGIDCFVGSDGQSLGITNLTGHPAVVLPNGFKEEDDKRHPVSLTFTGDLFGESDVLMLARAYQMATRYHLERPPIG